MQVPSTCRISCRSHYLEQPFRPNLVPPGVSELGVFSKSLPPGSGILGFRTHDTNMRYRTRSSKVPNDKRYRIFRDPDVSNIHNVSVRKKKYILSSEFAGKNHT